MLLHGAYTHAYAHAYIRAAGFHQPRYNGFGGLIPSWPTTDCATIGWRQHLCPVPIHTADFGDGAGSWGAGLFEIHNNDTTTMMTMVIICGRHPIQMAIHIAICLATHIAIYAWLYTWPYGIMVIRYVLHCMGYIAWASRQWGCMAIILRPGISWHCGSWPSSSHFP